MADNDAVPKITAETCIQRRSSLMSTEVNGETVLLHVESGKYFGFDAIAGDIWQRLEQPVRVSTLCDMLAEDYQADSGVIRRDVLAFVQKLLDAGVIEVCRT